MFAAAATLALLAAGQAEPVAVFNGGETVPCPAEIIDPPSAEAVAHVRCDRIPDAPFQLIRAHYQAKLEGQGFEVVDDFGTTALFFSRGEPPHREGALLDVFACPAPASTGETCQLAMIDRTDRLSQ
ncbi:MAG: hypothetical protein ACOC20_00645 [Oceanicaulis sp.]